MQNRSLFILIALLVVFDAIAINCSLGLINLMGLENYFSNTPIDFYFAFIANISWLLSALLFKTYNYNNIQNKETILKKSAYTFIGQVVLMCFVLFIFKYDVTAITVIYTVSIQFFLISIIRVFIIISEKYLDRINGFKKNIAIIGDQDLGLRLEKYFLQNKLSFNLTGYFNDYDLDKSYSEGKKINNLIDTINYAIENNLDEVYTTYFPEESTALAKVVEMAEKNCVRIKYATSFTKFKNEEDYFTNSNYILSDYYDGIPILVNRYEPLSSIKNRIIKRVFDIAFSLFVIVFLLSWLMPLMMLLIRLESKGATIFMQLRSGRDNNPFYCYKFRSMAVNKDSNSLQATKNDPRVTKLGAFMRKTSIDELPQFFNVLMGDMSIVGPRPHMLKHTEEYSEIIDKYMIRQFLKPGITGWAQINGFRGETKHQHQMLNRVKHDIWYMENWTLWKDIKIIILTVVNAVRGEENAY
jgi:putative colanic acid biosynthesis UDP-glucose lipid carrier transferase